MSRKIEIRDCMERALDTELELSGSVSYHRTCPNAPNPAIQVEGLGTIGLPLSSRDVEALKSKAHKVTFDKCERTEVDVTICDTWEMDAKTVVLANPDWQTFLTNTVTEVCDVLGVDMEAGAPCYELFKLLLHGTGSHSLPHVYTERGDGTFATIIFVLPSEFTGGQSRVNYDATSEVYDCSTKSLFQTSVMAWYTGVTHELKPISSGYRLVLSYHLVHTLESPLPAVSTNTQFTKEVSASFDQWREAGGEGPQKLVYLLSHKYSETGIQRSTLKGEDAVRVAILSVMGKELGFQLGLSNVFCTIGGVACEYSRDPKTGTYSGGRDIDPNVVEFREIHGRIMSLGGFVDMDGDVISNRLERLNEEDEFIPLKLHNLLTKDPQQGQDLGPNRGFMGRSLCRWYRRTALVIWPNINNYEVRFSGNGGFRYACKRLFRAKASEVVTSEEQKIVNLVLSGHTKTPPESAEMITNAVCHAAVVWEDHNLWNQAIEAGCPAGGLAIIDDEDIFAALKTFTLIPIQASLEALLTETKTNSRRFEFLNAIKELNDDPQYPRGGELLPWAYTQTQTCLRSIRKPTDDEIGLFTSLAEIYATSDLRDVVLSQVRDQVGCNFLSELAVSISTDTEFSTSDKKLQLISDIVRNAIDGLKIDFTQKSRLARYDIYRINRVSPSQGSREDPNLQTVKKFIDTCLSLNLVDHIGELLIKAMGFSGVSADDGETLLEDFILPLIAFMSSMKLPDGMQVNQIPEMVEFSQKAVGLYLACTSQPTPRRTIKPLKTVNDPDFMNIIIAGGGWNFLQSIVLPLVNSLPWPPMKYLDLASAIDCFSDKLQPAQNLQAVITSLANKCIMKSSFTEAHNICKIISRCIEVRAFRSVKLYLGRIANTDGLNKKYISDTLIPLIPRLREIGNQYGTLDTFAPTFQFILAVWINKCLGPKPTMEDGSDVVAQIAGSWKCSCSSCTSAKNFLVRVPVAGHQSYSLNRIGAPGRRHVETQLSVAGAHRVANWAQISSCPQGLQIILKTFRYNPAIWRRNLALGAKYLEEVSPDEDELRRLLGQNYATIVKTIRQTADSTHPQTTESSSPAVNPLVDGNSSATPQQVVAQDTVNICPPAKKRKITDYIDSIN